MKSLNYHQNNNSIQAIDLTVNSKDDVAHLANQQQFSIGHIKDGQSENIIDAGADTEK